MAYSRWTPFLDRTVASQLFKRHHTHLNSIYWSYSAARSHAFSATKGHATTAQVDAVFDYAKANKRLNFSLGTWAENLEHFDRWTRYAAVLAIAGYLEMFLAQVCAAAIESAPAVLLGGSREIDGVVLLKRRPKYSFYDRVESLIRGDWNARVSAYTRLFGTCPFVDHTGDLERLRKLRNDAGHCFGRDISHLQRPESGFVSKLGKISDPRLAETLATVEKVAACVEDQLAKAYIGSYELVRLYHTSLPVLNNVVGKREKADAFNKIVNNVVGSPCGKAYASAVIETYNRA